MGQSDISEKLLEDYSDVFADIVNVLLFHGHWRVKADSLEEAKHLSQYKADDGKLHEQERDVVKYWRDGNISLAIYGLENQTVVDGQMPVRIFGYEGANYRSQYGNEYISPVVTIVLYFGTSKRWDKPIELKDIMSIPDELQPFVNNCRANVIDIAWLPDEQIEQFCSDFGIVARFFSSKRKNPTYVSDDKRFFTHTDAVLKFLHVMTGDSEYEKLLNNSHFKKEGASMCSVAQSLKAMGREEERLSAILRMIEKDFDKEVILSLGYSETEYEQAERQKQ